MSKSKARARVCLVDGSGFIFRAYHALPPLTRADGTPVGAVMGFCNMVARLIETHAGDRIAIIFDTARTSFRNKIYPEYKAHRPDPPEDLVPQFALVRDATRAFDLPAIELAGFEADDLIATYARLAAEAGDEVVIVSSDKDLMQLVRPGVAMLDPIKQKTIGEAEVVEKFGVKPDRVVDVQSLAGDSTDNVPGVPGIGVKTAAELINTYGDLDTLLKRAGEIKQPKRRESLINNAEMARISRELVRLKDDVPVPVPLSDLTLKRPDGAKLRGFLQAQGFRTAVARLEAAGLLEHGGAAETPEPSAKAPAGQPAAASGPARYELVLDLKTLDGWIERARAAGVVAIDTETTSLDALNAALVGVSLCIEPGHACYIPVGHVPHGSGAAAGGLDFGQAGALVEGQIPREKVLERLKPLLADPATLKIGHNIKYDLQVFSRHGLTESAAIDDTMLISHVLEGGAHGHGMDELAELHLGHKTIAYDEVTGTGKARISFAEVALDKARDYAAEDAEVTMRLHQVLKPRLAEQGLLSVYEKIERPLIPVIVAMEAAGICVDRGALQRLSNDFALRLDELEKQIHKEAGHPFNVGSPAQLGKVLFDELSLSLPDGKTPAKTKTGAYATGADVLDDLAALGHKLPQLVLDWRQLAKLKSTYTDALVEAIDARTGRVHTSFALAAASTGRLASTDPNLQNIPVRNEEGRKIREAFVPAKGKTLLSFDYSQIELRLLAHVADIGSLKEAFEKGQDIHATTASEMFGVPIEKMDKETRRRAKAINFGIIYGISAFGLARQLGIPQGEAREYIESYFKRYPGIRAYMDRTKKDAHQRGYVTTPFGRRIWLNEIGSKNPAMRNFAERAAINAPIQGGAADIIKRAMIRIPPALIAAKLDAQLLLQVHDELLFEVDPACKDETVKLVSGLMENAAEPAVQLSVRLQVDWGSGPNWSAAH
ncbi:MAG: DNA polymerase I [Alphaproteobacteria bacterium]|nr:DNA polymerase I [Alphaproteobacteria bacterium]